MTKNGYIGSLAPARISFRKQRSAPKVIFIGGKFLVDGVVIGIGHTDTPESIDEKVRLAKERAES